MKPHILMYSDLTGRPNSVVGAGGLPSDTAFAVRIYEDSAGVRVVVDSKYPIREFPEEIEIRHVRGARNSYVAEGPAEHMAGPVMKYLEKEFSGPGTFHIRIGDESSIPTNPYYSVRVSVDNGKPVAVVKHYRGGQNPDNICKAFETAGFRKIEDSDAFVYVGKDGKSGGIADVFGALVEHYEDFANAVVEYDRS